MISNKAKTIAIVVVSLLGITTAASTIKYITWRNDFEIEKKEMACYSALPNPEETEEAVRNKLKLVLESEESQYMELSVEETLILLREYVNSINSVSVLDLCIQPSAGLWQLYLQAKVTMMKTPWVGIVLEKDSSGSLKASKASIADVSFPIPTTEEVYYKAYNFLLKAGDKMTGYLDTMDNMDKKIELEETKIIFNNLNK